MTASYENLAVYKSSFDLCVYFEKIVKNFNKGNKYTIGKDLKDKSREIAVKIIRANFSASKIKDIHELLTLIYELLFLIRLCQEINGFHNKNSYNYASKLSTNLLSQANYWLLCSQKREQTENPRVVNA